ncbi:MAG: integrase core domain-containing protein [Lentisphaeria bacterium]|nr:integrase core domain-containing protein [Lentisphaeria bacterium]
MKRSKKSKKLGTVNLVTKNLNAFMTGMENSDMRQVVANLQAVIEYKEEELRIYRKKYKEDTGKERPDLTDSERRSMARKGKALNKLLLSLVGGSWSPQTVMSWYKTLIADKYNSVAPGQKKRGRKRIPKEIEELIIKIAKENRNWGYKRVQETVVYLMKINISVDTVKRVMNRHGYFAPPDGRVNSDFNLFFDSHKNVLAACDFCTYELFTPSGLARRHILFFEDITMREVWCGGIAEAPNGNFMAQVARNQVDYIDGKLNGFKYIIHDNDTLFSGRFTDILSGAGCKTKHTRPFCPEQNGYVESFVKTFKTECLDQLILTSDEQLRYVVQEFLLYYNHERPHSGLGGKLIDPWPQDDDGEIVMFSRLGGLLKSYRRVKQAA